MRAPLGIKKYLGPLQTCIFDTLSGKCVAWGRKIKDGVSQETMEEIKKIGEVAYILNDDMRHDWYLITKNLAIKEAIAIYGDIKRIQIGPRGGYRTITFGKTTFKSRRLDPRNTDYFDDDVIEIVK